MVSNFDGLNGTYGAFEIGVLVATFLYGIETLQTYNYFRRFPKDSSLLKATVAVTWCLNSVKAYLYSGTITFYGKAPLEEIAKPPRSVILEMFFSSVSCTVVQLFFGNRIRLLGGNWHIVFLCFLLTIAYLIGSLVLMAELWTSSSVATFLEPKLQWQMIVFTSLGPVVDILLALSMSFHLWRLRDSGPQFKWTRRTLDTLLLWTVETAVLTR
ncbi:hypothetical protein B0H13DRAFT_608594 [Mycena leptocephala]|nr:hypothetical protein B0H13DRAFT_608594 [Mycena leptocephala]